MFKVISRNKENGTFGVLDTDDFVVEFYEFGDLKEYVKKGIPIEGICYDESARVWDVKVQKGLLPRELTIRIYRVIKSIYSSSDSVEVASEQAQGYYLQLQKLGENLLNLSRSVTVKDIEDILC